jgi:stearoyl-CoA desaturase (delta-9 desaturase)
MTALIWTRGLLPISVNIVGAVVVALVIALVSSGCVSIYAHRHIAHGAITRIHPVLVAGMRTWIWMATGTNCRRWAALHIKHHRASDRPGDPHSPQIASSVVRLGPTANWRAYRSLSRNDDLLQEYRPAHRAVPDRWDRLFFDRAKAGVGLGLLTLMVALGPVYGFGIMSLQAMLYVTNTAIVNSLGHGWGYQRFTNSGARYTGNSLLLSFLTGGESFHNNHHGDPMSPYLAHARWEMIADWPSQVLWLWDKLALAELRPRRTPRRAVARWQFRTTSRIMARLHPAYRSVAPAIADARSHRRMTRTREGPVLKTATRPPRRGKAQPRVR